MILKARWVHPVAAPPMRDAFVELRHGRITRVGAQADLPPGPADLIDLGDTLLVPGLVNPHTHLELTGYAGALPRGNFWDWVRELIRLRAADDADERERRAVADGAWQSLRAGVTCVGDISRTNLAWRVLKDIPIRKVCFVELISIASQPPRDPDELRAALDEIVEDPLLTAGVSPHAPYTVRPDHVGAALALAAQRRRPWTMHLAETDEETRFLRGDPGALPPMFAPRPQADLDPANAPAAPSPSEPAPAARPPSAPAPAAGPVAYLARHLPPGWPGALAHMNYVAPDEIAPLAALNGAVVYCPRAHRFFGHPPYPLGRLLAGGVRVAIGTDSLASNDSLSILDELHHVHTRAAPDLPPDALLRMATLDAAAALNLSDQIGSIEPGKAADLAAFACGPHTTDPLGDLLRAPHPPTHVWVSGQPILRAVP